MSQAADDRYAALCESLAAGPGPPRLDHPLGPVLVHWEAIAPRLMPSYDAAGIAAWQAWLAAHGVTRLELTEHDLLRAAERVTEDATDPIQYDAVWVRDAAWGGFALAAMANRRPDAARLARALWRSFATPEQLARFEAVIHNPRLVAAHHPDAGMNAVHIRFDGRSPTYADLNKGGKPQGWNHKQNDALGLFLLLLDQVNELLDPHETSPAEWQALSRFAPYLEAIAYHQAEDAGAWEEIERLNTSSVGIVACALERLAAGLEAQALPFYAAWRAHFATEPAAIQATDLAHLARLGLLRVRAQLPGGESPHYPPGTPHHRGADAALLSLIAPAPLAGLTPAEARLALAHVKTLVRPAGVLRYVGDSYQAANAWFLAPWPEALAASLLKPDAEEAAALATASGSAFVKRSKGFVPGTEAQWFFDSWLAWCHAELYERAGEAQDLAQAFHHLNRALGQLTPSPAPLGADGRVGHAAALPESYNTIIAPDRRLYLAPSPVMPLNWARASLVLALAAIARVLP